MSSDRGGAWRTLLRAANGLGARRAEALFLRSCAVAGRLWPGEARGWKSPGGSRVVVIAPHPDDELACAGTLLRHRQAGDEVRLVTVTDGRRSRAYGFDPPEMAARRRGEAHLAASALGAQLAWLGLSEGDWQPEAAAVAVRGALEETVPAIVYAPSMLDYHPEHRRVALTLARVLRAAASVEVRVYAIQVPLTPLLANLVHDVSDLAEPIRQAYAAHATQRQTTPSMMRLKRYAARFHGRGTLAEAFCSMSVADYADLQARDAASFRAVRPRAWTDPLAAVIGARERLAWRQALRNRR